MKIERPDWQTSWDDSRLHWEKFLNKWFDENVTPINAMLADSKIVYGNEFGGWKDSVDRRPGPTYSHKAILINITPIKKESAESVLKVILTELATAETLSKDTFRRAKAVLGDDDAE